jgi:type III secretory pathway component EscS
MSVLIGLLPFILLDVLRAAVAPRTALLIGLALAATTLAHQALYSSIKSLTLLALLLLAAAVGLSRGRPAFAERGAGLVVLALLRHRLAQRWLRPAIVALLMLGAGGFTAWYPGHVQQQARAAAVPGTPTK